MGRKKVESKLKKIGKMERGERVRYRGRVEQGGKGGGGGGERGEGGAGGGERKGGKGDVEKKRERERD